MVSVLFAVSRPFSRPLRRRAASPCASRLTRLGPQQLGRRVSVASGSSEAICEAGEEECCSSRSRGVVVVIVVVVAHAHCVGNPVDVEMERAKMKWFMVVEKCRGPAMSTTEVARGVSATTMLRIQGCQIRGAHHINHYAAACPSIQALARSLARSLARLTQKPNMENCDAWYAMGRMLGCGTASKDVNLGTMSCPNRMNAPRLPI